MTMGFPRCPSISSEIPGVRCIITTRTKPRNTRSREAEKRKEAEARTRELKLNTELVRNQQMTELIKAENQKEELEKKLAKEQAEAAANPDAKTELRTTFCATATAAIGAVPRRRYASFHASHFQYLHPGPTGDGHEPVKSAGGGFLGRFSFHLHAGLRFSADRLDRGHPLRRMHRRSFPTTRQGSSAVTGSQPKISPLLKKRFSSAAAASGESDAWATFTMVSTPKSPRMVPLAAFRESVGPRRERTSVMTSLP